MITLDLSNPFKFTLKDQFGNQKEVAGTFRELTKAEHAEFRKKNVELEDAAKQGERLVSQMNQKRQLMVLREKAGDYKSAGDLLVEVSSLENQLTELSEKFDPIAERNNVLRERFNLCLGGGDREEILEVAELYGYDRVLEVILKSIAEDKTGK